MDHIRKAILKAKAAQKERAWRDPAVNARPHRERGGDELRPEAKTPEATLPVAELDAGTLKANRIVAHLPHEPASVAFDVMRTRVYQSMQQAGMRTLIVTSPSPMNGKTVTAINLAISLARQPGCFTVLLDCDFRRPRVAKYLGLTPEADLLDVLADREDVWSALQGLSITGQQLAVLSTRQPAPRASEVLSSPKMREVVSSIKSLSPETLVIMDVPPILVADDVLAVLPDVDGVLLVVAPDETRYADTEASLRAIPEEKLVGVAFAKSRERPEHVYYNYATT